MSTECPPVPALSSCPALDGSVPALRARRAARCQGEAELLKWNWVSLMVGAPFHFIASALSPAEHPFIKNRWTRLLLDLPALTKGFGRGRTLPAAAVLGIQAAESSLVPTSSTEAVSGRSGFSYSGCILFRRHPLVFTASLCRGIFSLS